MKKLVSIVCVLAMLLCMVPTMAESGARVAVICDIVGTNLFLTQVVEKAKEMEATYGYTATIMECKDSDEWQRNYNASVAEKYDLIVGVGWQAGMYAGELADANDGSSKFAVIDTDAGSENVMSISYNEEQAAYLMGVMAGNAFPDSETYGYIGCFEGAGAFKYKWGFCEGVRSVNPDAKFIFQYTGSYQDPVKPYEFAKQMSASGCTYIFGGAAAGNEGIFQAALELAEAGTPIYTIAQDADATTPDNPYILSAQLKNTGVSMGYILDCFFNDNFVTGNTVQELKDNAIGGTHITNDGIYLNSEILTPEVIDACKAVVEQIVNGELVLELPAMEDYDL